MQIYFSIKKKGQTPKFPDHELAGTYITQNTRQVSASCCFFPEVSTVGLLANITPVRFIGQKDHLLHSVSHSTEMPVLGLILPVHIIYTSAVITYSHLQLDNTFLYFIFRMCLAIQPRPPKTRMEQKLNILFKDCMMSFSAKSANSLSNYL